LYYAYKILVTYERILIAGKFDAADVERKGGGKAGAIA
jgi:hypothetical protein